MAGENEEAGAGVGSEPSPAPDGASPPPSDGDVSIDSTLDAAFDQMGVTHEDPFDPPPADDEEPKGKEGPEGEEGGEPAKSGAEEGGDPPRDEKGRFAKKEDGDGKEQAAPGDEDPAGGKKPDDEAGAGDGNEDPKPAVPGGAPERFSEAAKAEWDKTPDAVRAEIGRTLSELEGGINVYQKKIETYGKGIDDLSDRAIKEGTTVAEAAASLIKIQDDLNKNFVQGMTDICQRYGTDVVTFAKSILAGYNIPEPKPGDPVSSATPPDPQAQGQQGQPGGAVDPTIQALTNQVQQLTQTINTMANNQQNSGLEAEAEAWKAAHPRFEELKPAIIGYMNSGEAKDDIDEAYRLANQAFPPRQAQNGGGGTGKASDDEAARQAELKAQTRKGTASLAGSPPPAGSNPDQRKTPSTIDESLDDAFDRVDGRL